MTIETQAIDEMVTGAGGLRPHWRRLVGNLAGLGTSGLVDRAARLDRAFADDGVTGLLPSAAHAAWNCDPIPLLLSGTEFAALEAGLAQRARLLEAVLADLYGPQTLLETGALPPALVYPNPAFLRPCRTSEDGRREQLLHVYAADLIRAPDGRWHVLADRTAEANGTAYALENRRVMSRVLPELFPPLGIAELRPFFDAWQEALQHLAPPGLPPGASPGRSNPGIALLTPGQGDRLWFEHVILARELSCALVESGDLTARGGALFIKTLRGLQPVDVLLRRVEGRAVDPLELSSHNVAGVPGLLDAARRGAVRIVNDPGTALAQAPGLAAFLPALCLRLLGETLKLPSVPTLWLGDPEARRMVTSDPDAWLLHRVTDNGAAAIRVASLTPAARTGLLAQLAERSWDFAAGRALPPSAAPCVGPAGLQPRPVVLRMFLVFDGAVWRTMPGGLARTLSDEEVPTGKLPPYALSKDVWVILEERSEIVGPGPRPLPAVAIRRTPGDLSSRVADNFFWLGRYLERLEGAARLQRALVVRLSQAALLPREMAELDVLVTCLTHAGVLDKEDACGAAGGALTEALMRASRNGGWMAALLERIASLTSLLRDRLTGDMYNALTHALRAMTDTLRRTQFGRDGTGMDRFSHAMTGVIQFAATIAGLASENMVRGGGHMFLDLGRRMERAKTIAAALTHALEQPGAATHPGRIEAGLRLALELCDSTITYRARYLALLQPAPVLDLIIADPGNPRGLAFQLTAIRDLLREATGETDLPFVAEAEALLQEALAAVRTVSEAAEQAEAASHLPARLRAIETGVADLSDQISRHFFAVLPTAHTVGMNDTNGIKGAA
ncbi:MAG TPA: circularly permuted type 2 ATP-grasp protein [Acetobacteraceae bacterium]|nr:circularly permuted type 2 ATP-grasp protein [Acetobacteraceae bacterium]